MWKKLLVLILALVGTFSVGYAYYSTSLNAAQTSYLAGGAVSGRINKAPSNISGTNIGLQKGDKFYIGATNPKDGSDLGFVVLLKNEDYTDYVTPATTTPIEYGDPLTGWFVMSTESIAEVIPASYTDFTSLSGGGRYYYVNYANSAISNAVNQLTTTFLSTDKGNLLMPRDIKDIRLTYQN